MAGRSKVTPSYIVDLDRIVEKVHQETYKAAVDIVIPVYKNNFSKEIAEKMIFLFGSEIYQSIKSSFIEPIRLIYDNTLYHITDAFSSGGPSGYIPAWIEVPYADDSEETLSLSYYWR